MSKLTLSFKGKVLKVFPVLQGDMYIGSDPACTIHIDSLAVQPRHARLQTSGNTTVLHDLDTPDGTFVNQTRIKEHTLADGELIRVGKHTLSFSFEQVHSTEGVFIATTAASSSAKPKPATPPEPAPQAAAEPASGAANPPKAWLQILSGQNLGKTLSLNRAMTNLGKPGVVTAVIARRNEGYFMSHLEGEHRPLIDSKPIGDKAHKLEDGDIIQIGNVRMQFYIE